MRPVLTDLSGSMHQQINYSYMTGCMEEFCELFDRAEWQYARAVFSNRKLRDSDIVNELDDLEVLKTIGLNDVWFREGISKQAYMERLRITETDLLFEIECTQAFLRWLMRIPEEIRITHEDES